MADNTHGDTLQKPFASSIIERRQRHGWNRGVGWITINLSERLTMSCPLFCANPRAPASPSPLLVNDPHFWVATAVACLSQPGGAS